MFRCCAHRQRLFHPFAINNATRLQLRYDRLLAFSFTASSINRGRTCNSSSDTISSDDDDNITSVLCKIVPGVSTVRARKIVDALGPAVTQKIVFQHDNKNKNADVSRLAEIKGIGKRAAVKIKQHVKELNENNPGFIQLSLLIGSMEKVTKNVLIKIANAYGEKAASVVKTNPYQLVNDISFFGFKAADNIALQLGHARDSDFRIQAGIHHVLLNDNRGDTAIPINDLKDRLETLLDIDHNLHSKFVAKYDALLSNEKTNEIHKIEVAAGRFFVQHQNYASAERRIAESVFNIQNTLSGLSTSRVQKHWKQARKAKKYSSFTDEQWAAIETALSNKISVLDGGAGTGKVSQSRPSLVSKISRAVNLAMFYILILRGCG